SLRLLVSIHSHVFSFHSSPSLRDLHSFPTRRSSDLRHAEMCNLSSYLAKQAQSPESVTNHDEVLSAVNRMIDAEREMRNAVERRSEEHTSELQSRFDLVCRLLLEKKNIRWLTRWI